MTTPPRSNTFVTKRAGCSFPWTTLRRSCRRPRGWPGTRSWCRACARKPGAPPKQPRGDACSTMWSVSFAMSSERAGPAKRSGMGQSMSRLESSLERLRLWDHALCIRFNGAVRVAPVCWVFRVVSRLGDGVFWYTLMVALLAVGGAAAFGPVARMALTGLACTLIYKWLKSKTSRPRPFAVENAVRAGADPLDPFSFPSGHTLHAVAFSIVAIASYPVLAWLLVPFTLLVAASPVLLGLD